MKLFRLALAQANLTVGDLGGNAATIRRLIGEAREQGADLVAFPELALTGYPPEDLLLKPSFVEDNRRLLAEIASEASDITAVVGFVDSDSDIYNAAAVCVNGEVAGVYRKHFLPNYGVFDEQRYFRAGSRYPVYTIGGVRVAVNICEDIWYPVGPTSFQGAGGAEVVVNINASPYHVGKWRFREKMLATRAWDSSVIVAYCNLVGGQDELVFDGGSLIYDQSARLVARGKAFAEDLLVADVDVDAVFRSRLHDPRSRQDDWFLAEAREVIDEIHLSDSFAPRRSPVPLRVEARQDDVDEVYQALVLGTRDYVEKTGFRDVVIGLSGGIDSALTAAIAADALGPARVLGVSMPSRYSSAGSKDDAAELADRLGILYQTIPIEKPFAAFLDTLTAPFAGTEPDVTEENLQARIRGTILMALSNKFGSLVLTTGNKSEMATGYSTLYGDMAGGFAVLKDVPKTLVYALARRRNDRGPVIPEATITKPPSAELRLDQKDQDSLPPYDELDAILEQYVEQDADPEEIVARGANPATVARVVKLVDRSEYKRRQAAPGIKITQRAFGRDRRLPITNRYVP